MQTDIKRMKRAALGLLAILTMLAGCGEEKSESSGGGGSGGAFTGSLYAYQTIEYSTDLTSRTGYVKFAPSIKADGKTDESKTIELQTVNSLLFNSTEPGEFFLADAGTGQILRYALGGGGRVEQAAKVSLAAYGVTALENPLLGIASKTKGYFIDNVTLQRFIWDPSRMTIQSNGDLSSAFNNLEGETKYSVVFERSVQQIGKKLVSAYTYYDPITLKMPARSGLVVIDTETDEFTVVEHPTCGGFGSTVIGSDGYVYVASTNAAAAIHYAGQGAAPCIVRLDPDKGAFDDAYKVDISQLVGKPAGGLAEHKGSSVYVWGLNEELLPANVPKDSAVAVVSARAWETYRIDDLTAPTSATLVETPPLSFVVTTMRIDGVAHFPNADLAKNQTVLMDASTDPPTPALQAKGWIQYALRVQ